MYTLALGLVISISSHSQTILFEDNFDAYPVGETIAAQNNQWVTWSGGTGGVEDAFISSDASVSGLNSLHIVNDNDIILPLGNYASGRYTIRFKATFVQGGNVNVQHTCFSNWAADIFFTDQHQINYVHENSTLDGETVGSFPDTVWTEFLIDIDIDNDISLFYIDGSLSLSIPFSTSNNGITSNVLSCLDFYGVNGLSGVTNSDFYIDDFVFSRIETTSLIEDSSPELRVYPNPTNGILTIPEEVSHINVYATNGVLLLSENTHKLDLSLFNNGLYILEMEVGNLIYRQSILKQ